MKLIATLAALAALIGQADAGVGPTPVTGVKAAHTQAGLGLCTDKLKLTAEVAATGVIASKVVKFKLPDGFSLGTYVKGTHLESVKYEGAADAKGAITADGYTASTNIFTFTTPSGLTTGEDIEVVLMAVCNHMATITSEKYSWTAKSQKVQFQLADADDAMVESTDTTAAISAAPVALTDVLLTKIPAAGATGAFKILFTAPAAADAKKFVVNLPAGFTYKDENICKLGPAAAPVAFTALTADASPKEFSEYTTNTPAGATITAAALSFECDKIEAPANLPTAKLGDVAIRYGTSSTVTTHAGYATSTITTSPTKSPTAKAADSPASVATASGVVVGALGVAALFLA